MTLANQGDGDRNQVFNINSRNLDMLYGQHMQGASTEPLVLTSLATQWACL